MSKGSTPRPIQDKDQFDKNWDSIFNKPIGDPKGTNDGKQQSNRKES